MDQSTLRSLEVAPRREDFLLATAALQRLSGQNQRTPLLAGAGALVGFLAVAWPATAMGWPALLTAGCAALFALALGWVIATRMMRRQLHTVLRADGAFLRPFTLSADGDGVMIRNAVSHTYLSWAAVLSVEVTADQLLIRTDGASAVIVPKPAFKDVYAMRAFGEQLRTLKRAAGEPGWTLKRASGGDEDQQSATSITADPAP